LYTTSKRAVAIDEKLAVVVVVMTAPCARGERRAMLGELAATVNRKPRTLYRWTQLVRLHGPAELECQPRADRGRPRKLTPSAVEFLAPLIELRRGAWGDPSIAEIHREYTAERLRRAGLLGLVLDEFDRGRLKCWVDAGGRLLEGGLLPAVCKQTIRHWAPLIRALARRG
jgi:hypothetical protein